MTASPIPDHGRVVEPVITETAVLLVHEYGALRESLNLSPSGVLALSKELARLQAVEAKTRELLLSGVFFTNRVERFLEEIVPPLNFRAWAFDTNQLVGLRVEAQGLDKVSPVPPEVTP